MSTDLVYTPDEQDEVVLSEEEYRPESRALDTQGVDVQIRTARRFPRRVSTCLRMARDMVSANPDVAAECVYTIRRGSKNITGPSVRLAEIIADCWGNLRVSSKVTGDDGRFIVAEAMAMDLERNVAYNIEARRRITDQYGKRYSDDMIGVTAQAAISIALRNAIFRVIPRVYVDQLEAIARSVAGGKTKDFATERDKAITHFRAQGISDRDIWRVLDITGVEDMTSEHLATLRGFVTSVKEGRTTYSEIFATNETQPNDQSQRVLDSIRASKNAPRTMSPPPEPMEPGSNG